MYASRPIINKMFTGLVDMEARLPPDESPDRPRSSCRNPRFAS
jgi:hypothetical protein